MPFTLKNLKADLDDVGSNFDGAPDLEFRLATQALELERSGLGYQRIPPGQIVELEAWDAVRVAPGTWRGYEAGPDGLELIVIGAPNLGDSPRDDVEGQRDWWAD